VSSIDGSIRRRLEMPFLMNVAMGGFALFTAWACTFCLGFLAALFRSAHASWEGGSTVELGGITLDMRALLYLSGVGALILGVLAAAVTFGMWCERSWSRDLVMIWWASAFVLAILAGIMLNASGLSVFDTATYPFLGFLFCGWYFYLKGNVRRYFTALEDQDRRVSALVEGTWRSGV
jgi:hypothetical protein